MKQENPLLLDAQLCYAVYSTSLAMSQFYKPLLQRLRLTYPQYLVLLVLWERDGIQAKELARRLRQDPGSVTPLLKRLETEGLLQRRRDPADERSISVTLTAKGRKLKERALAVNRQFGLACAMPNAEAMLIRDALTSLRHRLQETANRD